MGILDRLKPQPRWKHADPAVRLEALRDLDDPAELAGLAETDPDIKIRKACIAPVDVSAPPTVCPLSLIAYARLLVPPNVPKSAIDPPLPGVPLYRKA